MNIKLTLLLISCVGISFHINTQTVERVFIQGDTITYNKKVVIIKSFSI